MPTFVTQVVSPRYTTVSNVRKVVSPRYTALQNVVKVVSPRYSNCMIQKVVSPRYSSLVPVQKIVSPRYSVLKTYSVTVPAVPGSGSTSTSTVNTTFNDSIQCGCNDQYQATFKYNSTVIPNVSQFTLTLKESALSTFNLTITDDGTTNPDNSGSAWFNDLTGDCFNITATENILPSQITGDPSTSNQFTINYLSLVPEGYSKEISVNASIAGVPLDWVGAPTNYNWTFDRKNYNDFHLNGSDLGYILYSKDQNMQIVRRQSANASIAQVLAQYGVPHGQLLDLDFTVGTQHRQKGVPIKWIQDLADVMVNEWTMDNGQMFKLFYPNPTVSSFTYDHETTCIESVKNDSGNANLINYIVASRSVESGSTKTMSVSDWNQYTVNFATPLSYIKTIFLQQSYGEFSDFLWYNARGDLVAATNLRGNNAYPPQILNGGLINISSCKFTWGEPADVSFNPAVAFTPQGKIRFVGQSVLFPDLYAEAQAPPMFAFYDKLSVQSKGIRLKELEISPYIPDFKTLQIHVARWLRKYGRLSRVMNFRVPLNPLLKPGMNVTYNNFRLGMSTLLYVFEVTHSLSDTTSQRYTSFKAYQYKSDISFLTGFLPPGTIL